MLRSPLTKMATAFAFSRNAFAFSRNAFAFSRGFGHTALLHRYPLFCWMLLTIILPATLPAQSEPGPEPTSPPQLLIMGHCLEHLRSNALLPHLQSKNPITDLRFFRALSNANSDIYLGSVSLHILTTGPLAGSSWGATGPFSQYPATVRFCYVHENNAPPDPWVDSFYFQSTPITSASSRLPAVINSVSQLDWLLQICRWMDPVTTPQELDSFRSWLDQPETRITSLKTWQSGPRIGITFTGSDTATTGVEQRRQFTISAIPLPGEIYTDLEVQP
jgi:hypothetical protein